MDSNEARTLTVLHRLEARGELKDRAAFFITALAHHNRVIERRRRRAGIELDQEYKDAKEDKIKRYTDEFKVINRKIKSMFDKDNLYDEMGRQFDYLQREIEWLSNN